LKYSLQAGKYAGVFQLLITNVMFIVTVIIINNNSVASVRKRTIPTERPPLVGEVSSSFLRWRVSRDQRNGSPRPYSRISKQELLLLFPSSSSIVFTRLRGPRSSHYFAENPVAPGTEPGPLEL
jgi:hypothetical protein